MAQLLSFPLTAGIIEPGLGINANGAEYQGSQAIPSSAFPQGVSGHIQPSFAPDGSPAMLSRITSSDFQTYAKIRSEIVCDQGVALTGIDRERWYVWDMFIPTDWSVNGPIIVQQIHDDPDDGEPVLKYINFGLYATRDYLTCKVPFSAPNESYATSRDFCSVKIVKGRWTTCALHVLWATDAAGFMEFAYDGRIVGRMIGAPTGWADARRPYFKAGLYNSSDNPAYISDNSAWYRNVQVWGGFNTAREVLGSAIAPALTRAVQQ